MAFIPKPEQVPFDASDPDDYRPHSRWAVLVDPGGEGTGVDDITLIVEEIAPGDRIPLHTHPINELIVIVDGTPEVTLGDETREVGSGRRRVHPGRHPAPHAQRGRRLPCTCMRCSPRSRSDRVPRAESRTRNRG